MRYDRVGETCDIAVGGLFLNLALGQGQVLGRWAWLKWDECRWSGGERVWSSEMKMHQRCEK